VISEEDVEFVKNNYLKIPTKEIAIHINKSVWTVYEVAKSLGIGNFKWTDEKIEILKKYYVEKDFDFLFNVLGTTNKSSIQGKASGLGLHKRVIWTDEYDEIVKKYYSNSNWEEIFFRIPNLTKYSLQHRATKLGLECTDHYWSEEELRILKEKYPYYPNKYLSDVFFPNRNTASINLMGSKLNLKKNDLQNNKTFVPDKMIQDLSNLGQRLNRTPSIDELVFYGLPSDKSYERYFGGYRKACDLAGLEINISLFGSAKLYYSKNNDVCYSHSELVITNFFIEHNIPYNKEKHYKKVCDDTRCGLKRMDWFLDNEYVVEYWGYPDVREYVGNVKIKQSICQDNNLKMIELVRKDMRKLPDVFEYFINKYL
jgi:hypothetical protein